MCVNQYQARWIGRGGVGGVLIGSLKCQDPTKGLGACKDARVGQLDQPAVALFFLKVSRMPSPDAQQIQCGTVRVGDLKGDSKSPEPPRRQPGNPRSLHAAGAVVVRGERRPWQGRLGLGD